MRLTEDQKATVLAERPGCELVRVGDQWAAVSHVNNETPDRRWQGQLVKEVRAPSAWMASLTGDVSDVTVWTGNLFTGRTRRSVIESLTAEAAL